MRISIVAIALLIINTSCRDWDYPQNFPIVFTDDVSSINSEGAIFNGSVESLGVNQNIIKYGFVWSELNMPSLNSSPFLQQSKDIQSGKFSIIVNSDLVEGMVYYVRAFIQTDKFVVYGNQVMFTSKGSQSPEILDFVPKEGFDGTEVIITGKNFSTRIEGNSVNIGSNLCQVIVASDSQLKIITPSTNVVGEFKFSVSVANKSTTSKNEYSILGPRIRSISKLSGRVGDLITFTGEFLDSNDVMVVSIGSPLTRLSPNQFDCYVRDFWFDKDFAAQIVLSSIVFTPKFQEKNFTFPENFFLINSWNKINDNTPLGNAKDIKTAQIGDNVYIIEGNALHVFNPITNEWSKKSNFPGTLRYNGVAFSLDNRLYYGFGETDFDFKYNDIWSYDPDTDGWKFVMNAPIPERSGLIAFTVDDKAYIGFGKGTSQFIPPLSDFWRFDPSDNSWTEIGTPLVNGSGDIASSFSIGENGFLIGIQNTSDVWEFNTSTFTWTRKANFPDRIEGGPALSVGSSGIVFSSSKYGTPYNNNAYNARVYEYNQTKDTWVQKQTFPGSGRSGMLAFFSTGKIYFGLGAYVDNISGNVVYTPDLWNLTL